MARSSDRIGSRKAFSTLQEAANDVGCSYYCRGVERGELKTLKLTMINGINEDPSLIRPRALEQDKDVKIAFGRRKYVLQGESDAGND